VRPLLPLKAFLLSLSYEAADAFQRYRFGSGLVVGTTLAAVECYEHSVRRRGREPSHAQALVIASGAAALTVALKQAVTTGLH
jgi:hypothetical protein